MHKGGEQIAYGTSNIRDIESALADAMMDFDSIGDMRTKTPNDKREVCANEIGIGSQYKIASGLVNG